MPYLCQLELLAGIEDGLLLKALEKHILEFVKSLYVLFRELTALAITDVLFWKHVVIEIAPYHELHGGVGSHKYSVHIFCVKCKE